MDTIASNKYIKFVIENYEDIKAIQDIFKYAQENLPQLVNNEIIEAIVELESYFEEMGVEVRNDTEGAWWSDPNLYDEDEEKGIFFGFNSDSITGIDWPTLCNGSPEDTAYLYVYVHTGNIRGITEKKEYIDYWRDLLKVKRQELRKKGILPWFYDTEFDYNDPYIVCYPLHEEVNMKRIANRENFRRGIQDAVKMFTQTILPLLKGITE